MSETKVALVTGANKGIGYEIAHGLGVAGVTVLVGARDAERGATAAGKLTAEGFSAVPVELDVTDAVTISALATRVEHEYGRLDILVNNAGIMLERGQRPSQTPLALVERTFATNVFAVVAVTNALLPLVRRAPAGRIVNVSSGLGSLALTADPAGQYAGALLLAYNASKSALNAVTVAFAQELESTRIKVNAACPGYTATGVNGFTGTRTVVEAARTPVRLAMLDDDGPTGTLCDDNGTVPW